MVGYTPKKNRTTGMVMILISVVINVVNDTRSGSVPNCSANIVVFAAAGIDACTIITALSKSFTGMKYKIPTAIKGDATILMTLTADT